MKINYINKSNPGGIYHPAPSRAVMRFLTVLLLFVGFNSYAQTQSRTVRGTVVDETGEAVIGAGVVANPATGTITDLSGKFSLNVPSGTKQLVITYIGYKTKTVDITNENDLMITLQEDIQKLDEVVVVGYGTQRKVNLTGAIAAINSEDLIATKSQNVQNMLTGKASGVRVIQKTSEPGEFNNQFDIRGFGSPLIVIDGVPRGDMERIDPNEVESISVLKDASAAIYGVRAANGVVLITTKRGEKNKAKIDYNMYYGFQTPAELLKPVDAIGRMTLFNEKQMRNLENPSRKYSDEQIAPYLNGERQSTDWYDAVMRSSAPQQSHNVSISGGGEKVDYFISFGYMDQKGFFKSDALDYNRYNVRSNINAQITNDLKISVKLSGMLDDREGNSKDSWEIFKNLWRSAPDDPIYANNTFPYFQKPQSADDNPVALIDKDISGYKKRGNKLFHSSFEGEYTVPKITGLKVKGLFSYDTKVNDESLWTKEYKFYEYNEAANNYNGTTRLGPTQLRRTYRNNWSTLWQASVNYDNTFEGHHVSGLLLFEEVHSVGDNIYAQRNFSIPLPYLFAGNSNEQVGNADPKGLTENASQGFVGKFNYDYNGRYLAEFSFRYDGSSKFPKDSRWGFFPGASVGWRMSEESFLKDNLNFVENLKLRASYGKMGDDSAAEYQFLTGYDYPNTAGGNHNNYPTGYVFNTAYINSLGFRAISNPNITWYTVKTLNIGVDADLWNGLFGFTVELFQRDRDGLLADRLVTLPGTFGSKMPQENLNSDRTKGIEVELRHNNKIGDFRYHVGAQISLTRGMRRYYETEPANDSYDYWRNRTLNRWNDIWFGWGSAGRYTSYEQIANSIYANSGTLPGDYIYEDWNNDGVIDDMDKYPIATTTDASKADFQDKRNYPLMNFGLNLGGNWKGLDLNLMFQGAAMSYIAYGEQLSAPLQFDGNALDMFLDRWRPADPNQHPYDPSTQWLSGYYSYGATVPDKDSRFMIQKGDYLRLKSAEVGYTLPKQWLAFAGVKNLRVYFNAYNLFTITGVKGGIDPEKPTELYGYMYPLNRTYNFGANITF